MNQISLIGAEWAGRSYLDIHVDGVRLADYFTGSHGEHPAALSPLGWSSCDPEFATHPFAEMLLRRPAALQSGRVPVLVCEECGDLACGAFAVRIRREGDQVTWSDWAFENGYEAPHSVEEWHDRPQPFRFAWSEYEGALTAALRARGLRV